MIKIIKETIKKHKRIIFNGNGYDEAWVQEAEKRGLSNLKTTPDALPAFVSEKSINLFTKHRVFSRQEVCSRYEILLENYSKTINIEALTMLDMVKKYVIPAVICYEKELAELLSSKKVLGKAVSTVLEEHLLDKLSTLAESLFTRLEKLEKQVLSVRSIKGKLEHARASHDLVLAAMNELRETVDELETIVSKKHWTLPTYAEILYSVID